MPALLADFGGFFAILFLLISFIGWIINMINAQNPPPAPNRGPQRRPRARDSKVQNEIEQFLQEAMGNKQRGRQEEVPADEIEVVEAAPPRRQAPRRKPRPVVSGQRPVERSVIDPATSSPERSRPGTGMATRLAPAELGSGLSAHVQDHMRERVTQETSQHLPAAVSQTVGQHLGEFAAAARDTRTATAARPLFGAVATLSDATGLIGELRKPAGVRKAIVLQEILARPRALRK